jgi:hypothetical protein
MKHSISTLLTTLLVSAAVVPNAMAQIQNSRSPVSFSVGSAAMPEQLATDSMKPTTKTEVLPELPTNTMSPSNTLNSESARSSVDRSSVTSSYPAYCPALPPGTKPDDWEYREALEKCLYGD